MAPLLDVIFLLLTFFIYSLVLTVQAELLPIQLPQIETGEAAVEGRIAAITVDGEGRLFLNREPVSRTELERRLHLLREEAERPAVFLALDAREGTIDRGPIFIQLIDLLRRLGIEQLHVVGEAADEAAP